MFALYKEIECVWAVYVYLDTRWEEPVAELASEQVSECRNVGTFRRGPRVSVCL